MPKNKNSVHPCDQQVIDNLNYFALTIMRDRVEKGRWVHKTTHHKTAGEVIWHRETRPEGLVYACTDQGRFSLIPEEQLQAIFQKEGRWLPWDASHVRPSGTVDVKLRDGREIYNLSTYDCYWSWESGSIYDIVAYRKATQ